MTAFVTIARPAMEWPWLQLEASVDDIRVIAGSPVEVRPGLVAVRLLIATKGVPLFVRGSINANVEVGERQSVTVDLLCAMQPLLSFLTPPQPLRRAHTARDAA